MERLGEASIVRRLVTIRTGRRRTGKLSQVRRRLQIRNRSSMTRCTGAVMNRCYYITAMTRRTLAAHSDRGISQPAGRVRRMVVTAVDLTSLICMTGGTGVARTRCDNSGYRSGRGVVELTVTAVVIMTGRTVTGPEVVQCYYLTPGADRRMTARARCAVGHLVSRTAVKAHVMSACRMGRMTVKVSGMTL